MTPNDPTIQPQGRAKRWSKEELLLLALLLLTDFEDARRAWARYAGASFAGLLDAVAFANLDALQGSPGFWFDLEKQQYAIGRRGYIAPETINNLLESVRRKAEQDTAIVAAQVAVGLVTIDQFQAAMVSILKPLAVAVAALGRGGLAQVGDDDKQAVTDKLLIQFAALDAFAQQIENGDSVVATPDKILNRARNYPNDAITLYIDRYAAAHIDAGFIEEISILGVAEHCRPEDPPHDLPDCVSLAALGWQPIGTIPLPGKRKCLWNCRCSMKFRRAVVSVRSVA